MEQKRTLWVIAASGVFLLVVVGAALILYSPSVHRAQAAQAAFSPNEGWTASIAGAPTTPIAPTSQSANPLIATAPANPFDGSAQNAVESSSNAGYDANGVEVAAGSNAASAGMTFAANGELSSSQPALSSPLQTANVTVIADNTTVVGTGTTTIDLNTLKSSTVSVSPNVTAQNAATQAQIAETQSTYEQRNAAIASSAASTPNYVYEQPKTVAKAPATPKAAPAPVAKAAPAPAKSAATSTASSKTVASTKTAAKPATATASTGKLADKFWVQAASYSTKKGADNARETLESNKIPSEIFTYTDANGTVYYRVRVGPYTTSTEAEYWKTQVAKIDKFATADSYIVNSSAKAVK